MSSSTRRSARVPLFDLTRLGDELYEGAQAEFARIARSGSFSLGPDLEAFEAEFATFCGVDHCVGASDGTEAIALALRAVGAGPGTEVVTVPHTFIATLEAIEMAGARPVLVDVDPATRCMDPKALAGALGPATRAVVPVHLYGRPAPMQEILSACEGIPVVEDAAQAHGARLDGARTGSHGAAGAFSFYPTKNLGAMGDGGALTTDDEELAALARSMRHHGADPNDANRHLRRGSTARLDNLQAALLRLKLPHLDGWNGQRREAAEHYRQALAGFPITLPPEDPEDGDQVFHLFVVELDARDRVLSELRAEGVGAAVHYPTAAHLQPGWAHLDHARGDFPAAEAAAARCLSLPIFPGITPEEIDYVADALRLAVERAR